MMITREEVCCDRMWLEIEKFNNKAVYGSSYCDDSYAGCKILQSTIWYDAPYRMYVLLSRKFPKDYGGSPIDYCPFCGKKLPEWLYPEDVICEEYGEDYVRLYHDPKYKPLPPEVRKEFDTDEWWKKRGL